MNFYVQGVFKLYPFDMLHSEMSILKKKCKVFKTGLHAAEISKVQQCTKAKAKAKMHDIS